MGRVQYIQKQGTKQVMITSISILGCKYLSRDWSPTHTLVIGPSREDCGEKKRHCTISAAINSSQVSSLDSAWDLDLGLVASAARVLLWGFAALF